MRYVVIETSTFGSERGPRIKAGNVASSRKGAFRRAEPATHS